MIFDTLKARRLAAVLAVGLSVSLQGKDFEATGLVEPVWEATLASTVLGRVESIEVRETDQVEPGTVLLALERSFEELDANRRQIVAESTVELELARAKVALLQTEFEGTRKIFENSGSISKEEFERARLDLQLAESELAQLAQRERIEQLEWQLAREQVSRREIRAPQAGIVVEVFSEVGEVCEPRQPLVKLVDTSSVRLTLEVDALRTAQVKAGVAVPVIVETPEGEVAVEGKVEFVASVVDGASGLRRVRVTIENPEGKLLPGLPARVTLPQAD